MTTHHGSTRPSDPQPPKPQTMGGWNLFGHDAHASRPGVEPDGIRVGDAERDQAVGLLGEHYAAGRLDQQEHQLRADRALQATLSSELDALFADLPSDPHSQEYTQLAPAGFGRPAPGGLAARMPPPPPALILVPLVLGGLFLLSALMHAPWFLFGGLIWLAVMFHKGRGPFAHRGPRAAGGHGRNHWQARDSGRHWPPMR